jgi:enediyne biosynthesis protein E5
MKKVDPRYYQIAALCSLLLYGIAALDFDLRLPRAILILGTCLGSQYVCAKLWRLPRFDPKSPLISGLSLCLLLRTNSDSLAMLAAIITISSKFLVRWRGKHLFNPTNFGLVALLLLSQGTWVSSGQWGSLAFFTFFIVCLGGVVVQRAARADVALAFLGSYGALVFARAAWLGDPFAISFHQLQNGALLLFAFFMISDPKTTPDSRPGRILFAVAVAVGAAFVQFRLFRPNGLVWSLGICSLLVPLFDWVFPGARYEWKSQIQSLKPTQPQTKKYEPVFT